MMVHIINQSPPADNTLRERNCTNIDTDVELGRTVDGFGNTLTCSFSDSIIIFVNCVRKVMINTRWILRHKCVIVSIILTFSAKCQIKTCFSSRDISARNMFDGTPMFRHRSIKNVSFHYNKWKLKICGAQSKRKVHLRQLKTNLKM